MNDRPYVTLVTGVNLPSSLTTAFALNHMGEGGQFPVEIDSANDIHYSIADISEGVQDALVWSGIDCLEDHMENVKLDDWMEKKPEYEESGRRYGVRYGVYHGQGIDVRLYYLNTLNSFN